MCSMLVVNYDIILLHNFSVLEADFQYILGIDLMFLSLTVNKRVHAGNSVIKGSARFGSTDF